jgi:hypothetical protein
MDQRGNTPDRQKKKKKSHRGHGSLSLVSVVCCQVEVSATSWSLVQRSPTDCGVSHMWVTMKPRRNEEAQAHIRMSSHTKKNFLDSLYLAISEAPANALLKFQIFWHMTFSH